jgi:hypothetical protein
MKNSIVILISIVLLTSCATQKTIELANGKMVTEKKFARMCHRAYKKSFGKMPKEDKKLFEDVKITVDTTQSGN